MNIFHSYFVLGGPFMYPLLLLLFGAFYFITERIIVFVRFDWNTTLNIPVNELCPRRNLFFSLVKDNHLNFNSNGVKFNTFMELGCQSIISRLEKNLNFLTAIATLAPITGFLGTVTGMIIAFREITNSTDVTPQLVAGGIYEALITTAAGLIITIFSSFFYFIFTSIIKNYSQKMEGSTNIIYKQLENPGVYGHEVK